ncbi:hypothetical protein [Sphingomicrobium clamense]|uniref:Uncharacterized protein n=1 Tax=Sphingomicrobium clamense TaxID=2851013 RepID=A0ABS6V5R8_9SPHN|nr:hypothetical protein [Sphingomicrobium sp. B8]MBW0144897.1 hypothetical protein [Sphingomicrobium sp. B8]
MSEERLANALTRARLAADRIDKASANLPSGGGEGDGGAAIRSAITPILAELDKLIADAEKAS